MAAADEYRTRDRRAIYMSHLRRGPRTEEHPRGQVLPTLRRRNFDVRTPHRRTGLPARGRRHPSTITRVILHQMGLTAAAALPESTDPTAFRTDPENHRLDCIIAHLIVRRNGVIAYTHDVENVLNGTFALRDSIEIEFEGDYNNEEGPHPRDPRPELQQIRAGRFLVQSLVRNSALNIGTIHPHQQYSPGSRPNCPGPDIWVNVGEWAVNNVKTKNNLNLQTITGTSRRGRPQTISNHMSNQAYRRFPSLGSGNVQPIPEY